MQIDFNIDFNIEEICKQDMSTVAPKMFNSREELRLREKHESHYRMFTWLGWQFTSIQFLDLGTRRGTSAICLADNPSNTVLTYDIVAEWRGFNIPDVIHSKCQNVKCVTQSVEEITDKVLWLSPIITLDTSHNGRDELAFLKRLQHIKYDGLVIMDDIMFPRKFPGLNKVWLELDIPKLQLPRAISHDTGTGIVIYGQHALNIT